MGIYLLGSCPVGCRPSEELSRWGLSWWGVFLVGSCPGWESSGWELSSVSCHRTINTDLFPLSINWIRNEYNFLKHRPAKAGVTVWVVEVEHRAEEGEEHHDEHHCEPENVSEHAAERDLERAEELADGQDVGETGEAEEVGESVERLGHEDRVVVLPYGAICRERGFVDCQIKWTTSWKTKEWLELGAQVGYLLFCHMERSVEKGCIE